MNSLYAKGRQKFLEGSISWSSDNIKGVLVDTGVYSVNLSTDEFLSAIPSGARISTSGNLASKTTTDGVADAADLTFTAVTGASVEVVAIYKDTGNEATSPLIAYIDTATGLPVTPNGGNIVVQWSDGSTKIFKL